MEFNHISVLLSECIDGLAIKPNGIYVDGTAGGAGHSKEIAKRLKTGGKLVAIDKDPFAITIIKERLEPFSNVVSVAKNDFRNIPYVLDELGIEKVDGVLLDLGVSSHQLDTSERGFSYKQNAPLDMRMSSEGMSAFNVVNEYSAKRLTQIFREYGEEKFADRIARNIEEKRAEKAIETTEELVDIIRNSIPAAARRQGGHPAKRVFQAIRIEVNGELESLSICLENTFERIKPGGRFVIITFHSLEDRMVKRMFAKLCKGCECPPDFPVCVCGKEPKAKLVSRKPITASEDELSCNKRSRSAKLRILEKITD